MRKKATHPHYDPARAFYVGLNKVKDSYTAGIHKISDESSTTTATMKGSTSLGLANAKANVSGSAEITGTIRTVDVKDISNKSELLAIAPQVFSGLLSVAEPVPSASTYETGRTYHYTGKVQYRLRTHDNSRAEGEQETAKRLGLWLIEIPNGPEPETASSVTWIVLSGSAQGQIKTELGGSVSDWRAGSDTMALFELMHAQSNETESPRVDSYMLKDPYFALAARNMLQDSAQQTVELAFTCVHVKDCATTDDAVTVTLNGWSCASANNREVPVSRVVVGTPYFVQMTKPTKRSLMRELREKFGFMQLSWSRKLALSSTAKESPQANAAIEKSDS